MIYIEAYAVLSLAKIVAIFAFQCVKLLLKKSGRVKFLTNFKSDVHHYILICPTSKWFPSFLHQITLKRITKIVDAVQVTR